MKITEFAAIAATIKNVACHTIHLLLKELAASNEIECSHGNHLLLGWTHF
jgi:hypothetical protein